MRDVELADDGEQGAANEVARARGNPSHGRREAGSVVPSGGEVRPVRRARRRWLLLGGALALLLAAVVVVDGLRTRARAAHLAAVAGLLEPVDDSLSEVWSQSGGWHTFEWVYGPDLMVTIFSDLRLVANDIVTGEQRWDVALAEVAVFDFEAVKCHALGADVDVSTHIACRFEDNAPPGAELPAYGPLSAARLVVFDAQTGETVGSRSLGYGFGTVTALGSDILVTTVLADGRVQVTREDPPTGRARWTVQSERPLPGAGSGAGPRAPEVQTGHGVITLSGPIAMALSEEGEVLGEWTAQGVEADAGPVELAALADGRFVVGTPNAQADVPYGTVSATDARDGFPIVGPLLALDVDDGSASDLLLTTSAARDEIVAVDARTGEPEWSAKATPRAGALLLDRRLITTAGNDLIALDTRNGRRLWTAANGPPEDQDLLTDGRVVLVPDVDNEESILTAVDITDGRVLWRTTGPPEVIRFYEVGRRLIALQQEQMIQLG
ncbi:PQQ-binding-like beta-propeller repeat protein [Pengzhenrongella frigida]|uniref:Pyrrolo-quinoline quinone repeat domain-containing protein n=1 Tax=Pengzhenrongella frigida TaxID=1259133 RepID=A0A4Q5N705_9MICO|nr:PQQ-binding-like beta-propeller repeat protein [Cellulomonas sp. HLT2-17]RYV52827.1 hypothetical protein EUA98_01045 [Cellulomonas sp. HLT2-17]